jgi:Domain of unknown function (DUF4279)
MDDAFVLISVQLFLQGEDLVPDVVSALIGLNPTKAHSKGDEWTTGRGVVRTQSIGLWKWGVSKDGEDIDFNAVVSMFIEPLQQLSIDISKLPGVSRSWVDVFACKESENRSPGEIALTFSCESLAALHTLGLPVEVTAAFVGADDRRPD